MTIKSLKFVGYKGFTKEASIYFAVPNGQTASGISVFVGSNNSGKSAIIETLGCFNKHDVSFSSDKRNLKSGDKVNMQVEWTDGTTTKIHTIETVRGGGSETAPSPKVIVPDLLALPSRRFFNAHFSKGSQSRNEHASSMGGSTTSRTQALDSLIYRLFRVDRKKFDEVLGKVIMPIPDWTIDQMSNGQYFIKFKSNEMAHTSDGIGEGIISLFYIVDALYDSEVGSTIVIDEPELSLHPRLQRNLLKVLNEFARDRQVIISTHSPYFLPLEHLNNGLRIFRVKKGDESSEIFPISDKTSDQLSRFLKDLNFPHVLGLDAKEIFFLDDRIILVEGQEDVVFYPKIADQVTKEFTGDFFGWGVGGASKMATFAKLLSELGFKKVVGILDQGKAKEKSDLERDFPDYKFIEIPVADVRNKDAITAKEKIEGLAERNGTLKLEFHTYVADMVDDINVYLK